MPSHDLTTDPPPAPTLPPKQGARRLLRTLDVLSAAGITGTDALTCLDALLDRLGAELYAAGRLVTPETRNQELAKRFGSDAVRVAAVLANAAEIRAELTKVGLIGHELDDAVFATYQLMRSEQIGVAEALDATCEALRHLWLNAPSKETQS